MVPHSWLKETQKFLGVADNIRQVLGQIMRNWKTVHTSNGDTLGEVSIQLRIFQGDLFFPLLFIIILIPLSMNFERDPY